MKESKLLSIGIDIGTSTFQMVISELTVKNSMPSYVMPEYKITDKKIIYRSRIYFTPILDDQVLDMDQIKRLLNQELLTSKIPKENIESGAIIVTGEAANKINAEMVASELAGLAGEFVVAMAGPDLEASLAGYGSGTASISEKEQLTLANLDVGGGTANVAVFQKGKPKDQYALHIGGRLIRLDDKNRVCYLSKKIRPLLEETGISIRMGEIPSFEKICTICRELARVLVFAVMGQELSMGQKALQIYHGNQKLKIDGCTISGGVGELLERNGPKTLEEVRVYGDIGPCLAAEIKKIMTESKIRIYSCPEKIRATVIGAGMHSMQLSGSTICYDEELLPMKNYPVVAMEADPFFTESGLVLEEMERKSALYHEATVFYFEGKKAPSYLEVRQAAEIIWKFYEKKEIPILLIFQQDMAKAMGQMLKILSRHRRNILCIDSVKVSGGDYIDFCRAVGETILVTVKTLLYKN